MRAASFRSRVLSLAKACSIGFVGVIGRQGNEGGATGLDRVAHTGDLVTAEIVQDDDIARPKRRREHLLDIGAEDVAVDGAVDDQWRGEAVGAQAGNEGRGFPVPVRDRRNQPLSRRRAPYRRVILVVAQVS